MDVNLSIKGVPQAVAERLRARAQRNHRSLQGELMAIVERAAYEGESAPAPLARRGEVIERHGTKSIEQVAAELRAIFPEPVAGPRAVDIVRELRDSR